MKHITGNMLCSIIILHHSSSSRMRESDGEKNLYEKASFGIGYWVKEGAINANSRKEIYSPRWKRARKRMGNFVVRVE